MRPWCPAAPARFDDRGAFASGIRGFGAACAVGLSAAASAAEPVVQPPTVPDLYIVTVNANLKADPRFPGSDRLTLLGYPSMSLRRAGEPQRFTAPDDGLSFSFLELPFLRFGVVGVPIWTLFRG